MKDPRLLFRIAYTKVEGKVIVLGTDWCESFRRKQQPTDNCSSCPYNVDCKKYHEAAKKFHSCIATKTPFPDEIKPYVQAIEDIVRRS